MPVMNIFESDVPQEGQRATESAHRKIELQTPADLTYLVANVSRVAREKIDRHLPPDAALEGEDTMRMRVEQLVDEYIRNTFAGAKHNISINGMDSAEIEAELAKAQDGEEIEPFDARLAQRIQSLSSHIEDLTIQLADMRREAPAAAARTYQTLYDAQSEAFDVQMKQRMEAKLEEARRTRMNVGELERWDEVQTTWQRSSDGLVALKAGLGATLAKMERAQSAVDYLEGR